MGRGAILNTLYIYFIRGLTVISPLLRKTTKDILQRTTPVAKDRRVRNL